MTPPTLRPAPARTPARALAAALALGLAVPCTAQVTGSQRTETLERVAVPQSSRAPATVVSLNEAELAAQIAARIDALPVRVGDIVEAGGEIAQLDCRDYAAARAGAEARVAALETRLALARRQSARAERLKRGDNVSEELRDQRASEADALAADLLGAQADREARRLDESRCRIASPFRALVVARSGAVGGYVTPGTPLARVIDLDALELSAQVAFGDDLRTDVAGASFEFAGQRYPLQLRTLLPAVDRQTRTREARFDFPGERPPPGAAGRLVWADPRPHVPPELIVRRGGALGLFTAVAGRAVFVPLPQAEPGRPAAVALPPEARIVVEGQYGLEDGAPLPADAGR